LSEFKAFGVSHNPTTALISKQIDPDLHLAAMQWITFEMQHLRAMGRPLTRDDIEEWLHEFIDTVVEQHGNDIAEPSLEPIQEADNPPIEPEQSPSSESVSAVQTDELSAPNRPKEIDPEVWDRYISHLRQAKLDLNRITSIISNRIKTESLQEAINQVDQDIDDLLDQAMSCTEDDVIKFLDAYIETCRRCDRDPTIPTPEVNGV
jgi:hypothetical protein